MRTWPELRDEILRLDLGGIRVTAERAAFERWCRDAEARVQDAVHRAATARAEALLRETGASVTVSAGAGSRGTTAERPRFSVVSLALGRSRVDVYSVRAPGESPSLHYGVLRGATSTRFPVLAPVPGCLVIRRDDGELELLAAPDPRSEDSPRATTTVDGVVLRAFELLVGAHRAELASARRASHAEQRVP
jgi:hypothetical protein